MYPEDRKYTHAHEWVREVAAGTVRIGITRFAAESLGDVVFVSLPEVGATVTAGLPCGEVESTKSVADLYSPVNGQVSSVNESLVDNPEIVNDDPHDGGWMVEVTVDGDVAAALGLLLTAGLYEEMIASHSDPA